MQNQTTASAYFYLVYNQTKNTNSYRTFGTDLYDPVVSDLGSDSTAVLQCRTSWRTLCAAEVWKASDLCRLRQTLGKKK